MGPLWALAQPTQPGLITLTGGQGGSHWPCWGRHRMPASGPCRCSATIPYKQLQTRPIPHLPPQHKAIRDWKSSVSTLVWFILRLSTLGLWDCPRLSSHLGVCFKGHLIQHLLRLRFLTSRSFTTSNTKAQAQAFTHRGSFSTGILASWVSGSGALCTNNRKRERISLAEPKDKDRPGQVRPCICLAARGTQLLINPCGLRRVPEGWTSRD